MQNLSLIIRHLDALRKQFPISGEVSVWASTDRDAPVAAIELAELFLPPGIEPKYCTVRIPLADTYGFVDSFHGHWIVLTEPLSTSGGRRVPFCYRLQNCGVTEEFEVFAFLREKMYAAHEYTVCLNVSHSLGGEMATAGDLIQGLCTWLESPYARIEDELAQLAQEYTGRPSVWRLARQGHLYEGLFRFQEAECVYARGVHDYRGRRQTFETLLERCRYRNERWKEGEL